MIISDLVQGTPAWHLHRAAHWNASDAPAMLGCSPYKTRTQLLDEYSTGIRPEVDAATQRMFDRGHEFEAMSRPIAEEVIGSDLYPCTGVLEGTRFSASFDGLTMDGLCAWEHKTLNAKIKEALAGTEDASLLPEHYRVQMEQQCMVSGAESALFSATKWVDGELVDGVQAWYKPDPELRERIIAGWVQFEKDLQAHVAAKPVAKPVGASPDSLPYLRIEAQGMVTMSTLPEFREHAKSVLAGINRNLQTDEDFADAEETVKWCLVVEDRLGEAKQRVIGQMATVDDAVRMIDDLSEETRAIRLELARLVKAEKESRKAEIVRRCVDAVRQHYDAINASMGEYAIGIPAFLSSSLAESIKGKRTIESITDACDAKAADLKIEASQTADRIRQNIGILRDHPAHSHLFPDRVQLCANKQPDDMKNLVGSRIAEHTAREAARIEAERERIRKEEAAKLDREHFAAQRAEAEERRRLDAQASMQCADAIVKEVSHADVVGALINDAAGVRSEDADEYDAGVRINLGSINAAIAPLAITAAGLVELGIEQAESKGTSKLYDARQFRSIKMALIGVIECAKLPTTQEKTK